MERILHQAMRFLNRLSLDPLNNGCTKDSDQHAKNGLFATIFLMKQPVYSGSIVECMRMTFIVITIAFVHAS